MLNLNDHKWVIALRQKFGIDKPQWFEFGNDSYETWTTETRRNHPMGWFLTETVPDWIEWTHDVLTSPYYNTRYYIRNRFFRKTHILRTDCPPGEYWDTDFRIITGLTNAVIDYVEIELAFKHQWCGSDEVPNAVWRDGRCPELGLKYLEWEMTLDDPALDEYHRADSQAAAAREIKAIYDWAKARPARPDPMDVSGWSAYCDKYRDSLWKKEESLEQAAESAVAHTKLREIEEQYEQEDEHMLIRLIKIRRSLWC